MVPKARHSRRGQSALEYLLTHGWALLVLALVIVVLYGIGIFNPNRYVAEECVFQPGFGCASPARLHLAASTAAPDARFIFGVPLTNNLGYDIAIQQIEVTSIDFITPGQYACSVTLNDPPNDITASAKSSTTGCMDWYLLDWDLVSNMYVSLYPPLLLNGQTKNINLVFKTPTGLPATSVSAGEVRELKFKITYRNCNTAIAPTKGWQRGTFLGPAASVDLPIELYTRCMPPTLVATPLDTSEHVLAGKIVSRVGTEINALIVTQPG